MFLSIQEREERRKELRETQTMVSRGMDMFISQHSIPAEAPRVSPIITVVPRKDELTPTVTRKNPTSNQQLQHQRRTREPQWQSGRPRLTHWQPGRARLTHWQSGRPRLLQWQHQGGTRLPQLYQRTFHPPHAQWHKGRSLLPF